MLELESGNPDAAVSLLRRASVAHPRSADVWRRLGMAHRAQGRLDEAAAACRRALEIDPGDAEAHYTLGNVEFDGWRLAISEHENARARERLSAAAHEYERAVVLEPGQASARYNLADALLRLGEGASVERVCLEGLRLHPEQVKLYYPLARAQEAMGKPRAALASYQRLVQWADLSRDMQQMVAARVAQLQAVHDRTSGE